MDGSILVSEGVRLLVKEAETRGWIEKLFDALKRKHPVIVFGSTGTGKSSLLRALKMAMPNAISAMNRTEYAEKRQIKIAEHLFDFIDTPGHQGRNENGGNAPHVRRNEVIEKARLGDFGDFGVLNLVADGFHEYRLPDPKPVFVDGVIEESWLAAHRKRELVALKEWLPRLCNSNQCKWILTVVSKADQWWSERERVIRSYEHGDYRKAFSDSGGIGTSIIPFCARIQKFYEEGLLDGAYDGTDLERNRTHLLRTLLSAIGHPPDE